jgi:DNA-binding PadR family transcriptional regulator
MAARRKSGDGAGAAATISTLGYALLGLVAREPLSGYDLTQRMKQRVGYFWQAAGHSHIYPELGRLEAAGLATHEVVAQDERPAKKVYAITDAGRAALRRWVTEPAPAPARRDERVLKAYSLWVADPAEVVALFRAQEQEHLERLARFETIRAHSERQWDLVGRRHDTPPFASLAALECGILQERAYAEWCRWVIAQVERALASPAAEDALAAARDHLEPPELPR